MQEYWMKRHVFFSLFIFMVFSFFWLENYNRYQVISYLEEIQLFRTDALYLKYHLSQFGGVTEYIGSFLTQFFYYPYAGAFIISLSLTAISLLLYLICKKDGEAEVYFLLFYPASFLLLFSCTGLFRQAYLVGILIVLLLFLLYLYIPGNFQKPGGFILFTLAWFVTGSLSFLLGIFLLVHYSRSLKSSFLYFSLLPVYAFFLLEFTYKFVYIVPRYRLFFTFTTLDWPKPNRLYIAGLIAIVAVYLLWTLFIRFRPKTIKKVVPFICLSYFTLCSIAVYGTLKYTDKVAEIAARMEYEAQRGNWHEILKINRSFHPGSSGKNSYKIVFFTNMALSEQGKLLDAMFQYPQIGSEGLFPVNKDHYDFFLTTGEFYYRLGLVYAGEQCAFEALVSGPYEYSSRALRRLVETNTLRRDTAGFEKYTHILLQSPVYRKWALTEKDAFYKGEITGNKTVPFPIKDFLIAYDKPDYNIGAFLAYSDEKNNKAFEYMMAYLLLRKDMETFVKAANFYWEKTDYQQLPTHLEEGILLCRYQTKLLDEKEFNKFPIPEEKKALFKKNLHLYNQ